MMKVFDASIPPESAPPGAEGVLGYVGRPGFTPHVWTPDEWRRFSHLRQFPAWLPDLLDSPHVDALQAVDAVKALGWAAHMPAGTERAIVFDGETEQIPGYYQAWAATVGSAGFFAVDYGSYSTVLGNAAYDVWAADWNGIPALEPGQTVHGDQYRAGIAWQGTQIDLSVVDASLFDRGGRGARHG